MNYDNLKKVADIVKDDQYGYMVITGEPRLFCDGRLMCLAGEMEIRDGKWGKSAIELWEQKLAKDDREKLEDAGIIGSMDWYGRQFVIPMGGSLVIAEMYRRVFSEDAEFRGSGPTEAVTVYETGALVGILMPVELKKKPLEAYPSVPYLADDVVYHLCSCDVCDMAGV